MLLKAFMQQQGSEQWSPAQETLKLLIQTHCALLFHLQAVSYES